MTGADVSARGGALPPGPARVLAYRPDPHGVDEGRACVVRVRRESGAWLREAGEGAGGPLRAARAPAIAWYERRAFTLGRLTGGQRDEARAPHAL